MQRILYALILLRLHVGTDSTHRRRQVFSRSHRGRFLAHMPYKVVVTFTAYRCRLRPPSIWRIAGPHSSAVLLAIAESIGIYGAADFGRYVRDTEWQAVHAARFDWDSIVPALEGPVVAAADAE